MVALKAMWQDRPQQKSYNASSEPLLHPRRRAGPQTRSSVRCAAALGWMLRNPGPWSAVSPMGGRCLFLRGQRTSSHRLSLSSKDGS